MELPFLTIIFSQVVITELLHAMSSAASNPRLAEEAATVIKKMYFRVFKKKTRPKNLLTRTRNAKGVLWTKVLQPLQATLGEFRL